MSCPEVSMHMFIYVRKIRQVRWSTSNIRGKANKIVGPHSLGGECADNFETASKGAVAGETTTMITFATQTRAEEDRSLNKVVEAYNAWAESTGSYIDYSFDMVIVRNDAGVWGITSCKLFMTYEPQRLADSQLLDAMVAARMNLVTAACFPGKVGCISNGLYLPDDPCRKWWYDYLAYR